MKKGKIKKKRKKTWLIVILILIPFIIYGGIYLYAAVQPKLPIGGANGYYFYDSEGKAYDTGATED